MKIRTDFVTNSSSSSFVSFKLSNSEFCKYVFEKMQEMGLDYNKYSNDCPGSDVSFNKDYLNAAINVNGFGLHCDNYTPEIKEYHFNMDLECVEDYLLDKEEKAKFRQIIADELGTISFSEFFDEEELETMSFSEFLDEYGVFEGEDSDHFCLSIDDVFTHLQLCTKLFQLLKESACDEKHVKKSPEMIHVTSISDDDKGDFINFFDDSFYAYGCDFDRYTEEEKNEDIAKVTASFFSLISEFLPLYEIDEEDKLAELFKRDRENGKFSCNVYMGNTD